MLAQDSLLPLPPPIVQLIEEGYLDDDKLPAQGLPVNIMHKDFQNADVVEVHWYAMDQDGNASDWVKTWTLSPAEPDYDSATQTLAFFVPARYIAEAAGSTVFLNWLWRPVGEFAYQPSQRLRFYVGRLPPVVQVRHAHRLQIAPSLSIGDIEVVGPVYASLQPGDIATLHAIPSPAGTPVAKRYAFTVQAEHLGQPLRWAVEKSFLNILQALKKAVDLHVELELGGSGGTLLAFARQRFDVVPALTDRESPVELPGVASSGQGVVIDPAEHPSGLEVRIPLTSLVQRGDSILLRASASMDAKSLYVKTLADLTTVKRGVVVASLPQAWLVEHQNQDLTLEWQADRVGASFSGEPLQARIEAGRTLGYPSVPQATAEGDVGPDFKGFVLAKDVASGLRVQVPADVPLRPGEALSINYDGSVPGSQYESSTPEGSDARVFRIPARYLAPNMGGESKRAPIYYTIATATGTVLKSNNYQLWVTPLSSTEMQNVECAQAPGGQPLSIRELELLHDGKADISQPAWPLMAAKQRVVIRAVGISSTEQEVDEELLDQVVDQSGDVKTILPTTFLKRLKLNEQFDIEVKVAFDGVDFILQGRTALNLVA